MPSILTRPSGGSAGGSLSIAVSSATPDYNGSLTITATPSGITPTSYTFQISDAESGIATVSQVSNVLAWTVNKVGTVTIGVTATDGSSGVGSSTSITVVDPLNYATKLFDYDMRNNITLVDGLVDVVGDSSGNGHDVTAISSVNRAFYDAYGKRYDTGGSVKNLRNTASNPLSGAADFTMFIKAQKQASGSVNNRIISFGNIGTAFGIAPLDSAGATIYVGTNDFAQYATYDVDVIGGEPFAVVKNGANPYDVYADGVFTPVVAAGGSTPATLPTGNGIYLGTQNGNFPLIGCIQRIAAFDSVLTATQIAAINERIKTLHP